MSGTRPNEADVILAANSAKFSTSSIVNEKQSILDEAHVLYDSMKLKRVGLTRTAFEFAWQGYKHLIETRKIYKKEVLSICDFSQSSKRKRLYIIDVASMKVLVNTYVAHGRRSGGEYAKSFSNNPDSHKSSLGFFVTRKTYYGGHGLALTIDGLEDGINNNADQRKIVVHGSEYVGANFLRSNKFNGRSFGCPAVPAKETQKVINTIKDGSCLFIYHPSKNYITKSKILND
ncbi:MAG: murein L,D-transpeptidase catalytic domain family protein [Chitinophagaceae bacterium]|nr:murein L,D-transpeptidase catalytic domain family protein [Chitinophagaceae bacterium]